MKDTQEFRSPKIDTVPGMKNTKLLEIPYPQESLDPQEIEQRDMFDPNFDIILRHLDRILDQIPEKEYELKNYIIEATLTDTSDDFEPESLEIIKQGMIKFGPVEQILVQNV